MTHQRQGARRRAIARRLRTACLIVGLGVFSATAVRGVQSQDPQDDEVMEPELDLAELQYKIGVRVVFSYDEGSREFGLLQQGVNDRSGPLVRGELDSLLAVYLAITPRSLPVPAMLLAEAPAATAAHARATRAITSSPVRAIDLDLPVSIPTPTAASQSCYSTYYDWWDWHDAADEGMAAHTYYSSSFSGKQHYSDSYVLNCIPAGSPSWLWARHRIYYKNVWGNYKKHFDSKVSPWHWESKHKGSLVKRYRKVAYTDGWNSLVSCGSLEGFDCKYTREGRFHN